MQLQFASKVYLKHESLVFMPSPRFFEMIIYFLDNFSADVVFPSNKLIMKSIARVSVFSTNIYQAKMERKFLRTLFVTESWFCWEMNILHTKSHFISLHRFNDACLKCLTTSETSSERNDLNSNAFLMITVSSLLQYFIHLDLWTNIFWLIRLYSDWATLFGLSWNRLESEQTAGR